MVWFVCSSPISLLGNSHWCFALFILFIFRTSGKLDIANAYILLHYIRGIILTIGKVVTFKQRYFQREPRAKLYFAIHAEALQEPFQFKNQQTITSVMVITHFKLLVPRADNFTLSHILSSAKMGWKRRLCICRMNVWKTSPK